MSKAASMDKLIDAFGERIDSSNLLAMIRQSFGIDLEALPVTPHPRAVIDSFLEQAAGAVTGPEVRSMLNETLAVNLDALSALEQARISLFSKGQWMLRQPDDLFAVHTGEGDVDVAIYPTEYYMQQTGSSELPKPLIDELVQLGFTCGEGRRSCTYANPAGEPVSDAFKGRTMRAVTMAAASLV
ncbi:hypothetical protein [Paenibacillus silvisoli]|uniref:hypothetical protein n=1 Tax=Paenibacillus silvisoli TaxID=3110539 RepID=UPI002805A8B0|nr:hypothetical protein [Paenibacillus silvisoli]